MRESAERSGLMRRREIMAGFLGIAAHAALLRSDTPLHGTEGARKGLTAHILSYEDYYGPRGEALSALHAEPLSWTAPLSELDQRGIRHGDGGTNHYLIFPPTSGNIESLGYYNCLGAYVVGTSRKGGAGNLSFLTHQPPGSLGQGFERAFPESLNEFCSLVKPGSVEAFIFGGMYSRVPNFGGTRSIPAEAYLAMVGFMRERIVGTCGTEPVVPIGPNRNYGFFMNAVAETQNRTLHLVVPRQPEGTDTGSFLAADASERLASWPA